MPTTLAPVDRVIDERARLPLWRSILSRVGLVLAGFMALINTLNGILTLVADPDYPVIVNVILISTGLITLVALVPAWRGRTWAIWAVVGTRLVEGWSVILPIEGSHNGPESFYATLLAAATVVAALVALALRPTRLQLAGGLFIATGVIIYLGTLTALDTPIGLIVSTILHLVAGAAFFVLLAAGVTGPSRYGRAMLAILAIDWTLVALIGVLVSIPGLEAASYAFVVTALTVLPAGILAGVQIGRARILPSPARWSILVLGIGQILDLVLANAVPDTLAFTYTWLGPVIWVVSGVLFIRASRPAEILSA